MSTTATTFARIFCVVSRETFWNNLDLDCALIVARMVSTEMGDLAEWRVGSGWEGGKIAFHVKQRRGVRLIVAGRGTNRRDCGK